MKKWILLLGALLLLTSCGHRLIDLGDSNESTSQTSDSSLPI